MLGENKFWDNLTVLSSNLVNQSLMISCIMLSEIKDNICKNNLENPVDITCLLFFENKEFNHFPQRLKLFFDYLIF